MHEFLQPLTDWSIQILEQFGMIGLFIFSFTESLFHPIPVDPILIALEAIGKWSTSSIFFWATTGSVLGGLVAHYAGTTLGKKVFLHLITDGRDVSPTSAQKYLKRVRVSYISSWVKMRLRSCLYYRLISTTHSLPAVIYVHRVKTT